MDNHFHLEIISWPLNTDTEIGIIQEKMSQHWGVPCMYWVSSEKFILWSIEILVNNYDFGNYELRDISKGERGHLWPRFPSRLLTIGEYIKQDDPQNKVASNIARAIWIWKSYSQGENWEKCLRIVSSVLSYSQYRNVGNRPEDYSGGPGQAWEPVKLAPLLFAPKASPGLPAPTSLTEAHLPFLMEGNHPYVLQAFLNLQDVQGPVFIMVQVPKEFFVEFLHQGSLRWQHHAPPRHVSVPKADARGRKGIALPSTSPAGRDLR